MHKILIYLHIIHLLKSCTCFKHYPAHLQEVYAVIVYMRPLVSSLSASDQHVLYELMWEPVILNGTLIFKIWPHVKGICIRELSWSINWWFIHFSSRLLCSLCMYMSWSGYESSSKTCVISLCLQKLSSSNRMIMICAVADSNDKSRHEFVWTLSKYTEVCRSG